MDETHEESRIELDLDNRKLIIAFVLLMCVCGGFYVFGFVEGKRQAQKSVEQRVTANPPAPAQPGAPAPSETKAQSAESPAQPVGDKAVKEQLDWYKKVQSGRAPSPKDLVEDRKTKDQARAGSAKKSAPPPHKGGYSVQIGAFKHKREAEAKAAILKAKGYDYILQPPGAGTALYLLKVGRFESRAQAYAMQQKLKKDGFSSFIKTH